MFDIFFGWRKASKCKTLLKRGQCRLKLLKNKRSSIAKLLREDVAELISAGHQETALDRAEQLCNDLSLVSAYELLDQFCEFILVHLSYIRRHKDIPNDINEAVSSLIFASARCGDVPELRGIRKLFAERYGQRFATAAVELFPGNLVNHQIVEKLSGKAVPHDVKLNLFNEIARGCWVKQGLLPLEFASQLQKQKKENSKNQVQDMYLLTYYNEMKGFRIQDSSAKDIEGADYKCSSRSCQTSRQNSGVTSISISSSIACQSSNDTSEYQLYEQEEEIESSVRAVHQHISRIYATNSSSSSERSYQCPDENLIYLDDIEEFESPKAKDQRLFMFKSSRNGSYNESVETRRSIKSKKESDKCSLEHPCYCCSTCGDGFRYGSSGDSRAKALKIRTRYDHAAAVYDVFTYPDSKNNDTGGGSQDFGSSGGSNLRKEMAEPPYRRAATMLQERPWGGNIRRSNSCPYKHPSHVHPKLPDYDHIAATFMALKKDNTRTK